MKRVVLAIVVVTLVTVALWVFWQGTDGSLDRVRWLRDEALQRVAEFSEMPVEAVSATWSIKVGSPTHQFVEQPSRCRHISCMDGSNSSIIVVEVPISVVYLGAGGTVRAPKIVLRDDRGQVGLHSFSLAGVSDLRAAMDRVEWLGSYSSDAGPSSLHLAKGEGFSGILRFSIFEPPKTMSLAFADVPPVPLSLRCSFRYSDVCRTVPVH